MSRSPASRESVSATIVYDAGCNLCEASVRWLRARDRRGVFRFVALESAEGERELRAAGVEPAGVDSVVLIAGGRARLSSDAAIEALRLLGGPWSLAAAARILPGPLRDAAYRTIARHRHAWFGRTGSSGVGESGTRRE